MLEEIIKLLLAGLVSGIATFYCLIKYFFSSYASEKGKNLATKQDIAEITNQVEEVKHQYNLIMEQFKFRNQLRLAALDKRLAAHQEAYSLCDKIRTAIQTESEQKIRNIKKECDDWWWKNSLYLEVKARDPFWKAFRHLRPHFDDLSQDKQDEIIDRLDEAFKAIQKGVELPPINMESGDLKKRHKE